MIVVPYNLDRLLAQEEGQYFDRKSLWDGPPGDKSLRDRRGVRDDIAEYVAAFANADGGVLVLGVEDDRTLTGHGYPDDVIDAFLAVPQHRPQVHPAARPVFLRDLRVSHLCLAGGGCERRGPPGLPHTGGVRRGMAVRQSDGGV